MAADRPEHYSKGDIECIDAIKSATAGLSGYEAFLVGNIMKYIWRYKWKNGKEDLIKAGVYLEWLKEVQE